MSLFFWLRRYIPIAIIDGSIINTKKHYDNHCSDCAKLSFFTCWKLKCSNKHRIRYFGHYLKFYSNFIAPSFSQENWIAPIKMVSPHCGCFIYKYYGLPPFTFYIPTYILCRNLRYTNHLLKITNLPMHEFLKVEHCIT